MSGSGFGVSPRSLGNVPASPSSAGTPRASAEDAAFGERVPFLLVEPEDLVLDPVVVLAQRGARAFVARAEPGDAEAVVLVGARPHEGMDEGHEVVAMRELRVAVEVAEVLHRDGLDARGLELLRDVEPGSGAGPCAHQRLDL